VCPVKLARRLDLRVQQCGSASKDPLSAPPLFPPCEDMQDAGLSSVDAFSGSPRRSRHTPPRFSLSSGVADACGLRAHERMSPYRMFWTFESSRIILTHIRLDICLNKADTALAYSPTHMSGESGLNLFILCQERQTMRQMEVEDV
jgi:hypothetical protein